MLLGPADVVEHRQQRDQHVGQCLLPYHQTVPVHPLAIVGILRAHALQVSRALGEPGGKLKLALRRAADLQRVSAEYANYRKRVDRDRVVVREQALANVLVALLPVLDDIGRAREHGELSGGFKSVAESLESTVTKLGLTSFGIEGEPFDPNVHEALTHSYSTSVTEPTCVQILQPGYKVGERIVRPARVAVAEPEEGTAAPDEDGRPNGAGSQESREDED